MKFHVSYSDPLKFDTPLLAVPVAPFSGRLPRRLKDLDAASGGQIGAAQADFHGKAAYLAQRAREHQAAYLCTLTMQDNVDSNGVARYPVGVCPILDPETQEVLIDSLGRRSYATSVAYGPSVGKNIALAYLPHERCEAGRDVLLEYFGEQYPMKVEAVGYRALYDPDNARPRS